MGFVSPDSEDELAAAEGEANNPPGRVQQRTPRRRGKLDSVEQKRVRSTLAFGVMAIDRGANFAMPTWWTKEDLLQQSETAALVDALYNELETFPKALQWLARVSASSVHIQLAYVVACIAAPRLERRGIVPPGTAFLVTMAPLSVEAGRPPVSERGNGHRQEHASSPPAEAVVVPDRHPDESGQA